MKNVRIVSDGTPQGTRVFDNEGKDITTCFNRVEIVIDARDHQPTQARLFVDLVECDVKAEAETVKPSILAKTPVGGAA